MRSLFLFLLVLNFLFLPGCKQATTDESVALESANLEVSDRSGDQQQILELSWEDLMPEGEQEVLTDLYAEFYYGLQQEMFESAVIEDLEPGQDIDLTAMIAEGSEQDTMSQIGTFNVVSALDGKQVRLPGYVVPLDFNADSEYQNFLLVPYYGACLHTPPPPPNQIISVTSEEAVRITSIYDPFWIEGKLSTGEYSTDLANSAYELKLSKLEPYE
jgi:Uncharacterized protein conserved in bacteria